MENETNEKIPLFMNLLSEEDKAAYMELQGVLAAPDHRYNRNKRIVTFQDMLAQIKSFCIKGDSNDWKRFLVCGICWLGDDIAINTRQLRILLGKSKSTINGAFSKMGYETLPFKNNDNALHEIIPFLKGNFSESRQWTVRRSINGSMSDTEKPEVPQSPAVEPKSVVSQSPLPSLDFQYPETDTSAFEEFTIDNAYDYMEPPTYQFNPTEFNIDSYEFASLKSDTDFVYPPDAYQTSSFSFKYL